MRECREAQTRTVRWWASREQRRLGHRLLESIRHNGHHAHAAKPDLRIARHFAVQPQRVKPEHARLVVGPLHANAELVVQVGALRGDRKGKGGRPVNPPMAKEAARLQITEITRGLPGAKTETDCDHPRSMQSPRRSPPGPARRPEVLAGKELRLLPPVRHASQAEASPWPERRAPLTFLDPRLPTSRLPLTGNPYGHAKDDLALDDSRCEWRGCGIGIAHLHGARMPSLCT